jgi:hypothetical protein
MLSRTFPALLALALALVPATAAAGDDAIRFTTGDGQQRAEFKLNGKLECVLENDRITCAAPSS